MANSEEEPKYINPDSLSKEQKLTILTAEFANLRKYYVDHGVNDNVVKDLLQQHMRRPELHPNLPKRLTTKKKGALTSKWLCFIIIPILLATVLGSHILGFGFLEKLGLIDLLHDSECLVENNIFSMEITRPRFDCSACAGLKEFPVVKDLSKDEFLEKYAYTTVPVLIKDATRNWTAMETFSFEYFQKIYTQNRETLLSVEEECQFFAYNTEFDTLEQVLAMPRSRASYKDGEKPWYVGW